MLDKYWEMLNVVGKNWENGCFVEVFYQIHELSQINQLVPNL
jgi:hypothetical protein